jgi:hypothetical protein
MEKTRRRPWFASATAVDLTAPTAPAAALGAAGLVAGVTTAAPTSARYRAA